MSIVIRAHFDGKVIVPDEPLDLPAGPVEAELRPGHSRLPQEEIERRLAALDRLASRAKHGITLPQEALSRESAYEPPRGL